MAHRTIPKISLHDFEARRGEIGAQIISAAENTGFFVLHNQSSPSVEEIKEMFTLSKAFFSLPASIKSETPFIPSQNTGWEHRSQIRPSTGIADDKESIQLQYHLRHTNWPSTQSLPTGWSLKASTFLYSTHTLSQQILTFFAEALGFPSDFFSCAHRISSATAMSTLRLLHYFPTTSVSAGAHTDFDALTLLFQRSGEAGLEVCPGREAHTSYALGDAWTPVAPRTGEIVCNIGDMLMAWSDDRFKSLFHRVRMPEAREGRERYSIAFFNQANRDVVVQGPRGKYAQTTAGEYVLRSVKRNFERLAEREREREREREVEEKGGGGSGVMEVQPAAGVAA